MLKSPPHENCPECHGVGKNDLGEECDCWDVYLWPEKYKAATKEMNRLTAKVFVLYSDKGKF